MDTLNSQGGGMAFDWGLFRLDVRRDVRNCALFLFFFYAVNILASIIFIAASILRDPAVSEQLLKMIRSLAEGTGNITVLDIQNYISEVLNVSEALLGLASMIGIVAGGLVFLILRKRRFFTDIALPAAEPITPKIFIILVVVTQCVQVVYGLIIMMIDNLMPEGLSLQDNYSSTMETLFTPVGLVYVVLIGPIFEELIFRGAIMGTLRRFGDNFAILFSSLLFGFYHMLIMQIPFAFVLGLLLGYVAARWSLRASIALHMVVNGLSALLSVSGSENLQSIASFAMVACAIATLVMAVNWREQLKWRIRAGAAYYAHTFANGFLSIAFWIFIVVMTGFGLLQLAPAAMPL